MKESCTLLLGCNSRFPVITAITAVNHVIKAVDGVLLTACFSTFWPGDGRERDHCFATEEMSNRIINIGLQKQSDDLSF